MSTTIKARAFLGFSLMLLSLNAFSFAGSKYLENVFTDESKVNLIAEDIQVLNAKKYIKSSFDRLSYNIYLNDIPQQENPFSFNTSIRKIDLLTKSSNHLALGNYYQMLGVSNAFKNNYEKAGECFEKALIEYQLIDNNLNIAVLSHNLSWIYYIGNDLEKSLLSSKEAISSINQIDNKSFLFGSLIWQNTILLSKGNARQVENEILSRILIMASRSNSKLKEWECYYQLGKSYLQQNKLVQAKWFFVQALTLSETFKDKTIKIKSLLMLARAKRKSKDYHLALQNLQLAQGLTRASNKIFEIDVTKQLAEVYRSMGNSTKEHQYVLAYNRLKHIALN